MKSVFGILLSSLLFLGCSSDSGGDVSTQEVVTPSEPIPLKDLNVTFLSAQQSASQVPLLVVQVDFTDYSISASETLWNQQLFGNSQGQLNHYFLETSQNSFSLTPAAESYNNVNDGIIKVSLPIAHPNPAGGVGNFQSDIAHPALTAADTYIDFSAYDSNANGRIDRDELQVMFLTAGGEQATGLRPGYWAHMSCIDGESFDGIEVMQCNNGSYTVFGERHFSFGSDGSDASIGIMAHELGHGIFYLPDLYDIDGTSSGIGGFGLMGSGSWGYKPSELPGETPVPMSAWSKHQSSFLIESTTEISNNNIPINATGTPAYKAIKVKTANASEYFLIENRSSSGYDAGLYVLDDIPLNGSFGGGVTIWHIDETRSVNSNETRKLVDLVEADGFYLDAADNYGKTTNLFYAGNSAAAYTGELTPTSTPSTTDLYSGANTGISIANISAPGSIMYLDLNF